LSQLTELVYREVKSQILVHPFKITAFTFTYLSSFKLLLFFETGSHSVAQAGLELCKGIIYDPQRQGML
jgi:hypothetical protein